ncbi:MAG TPA: cysteine desulfurase family protein [Blastocatellia bacterium]
MTVYLDNSATTAVAPEVLDAMLPYFTKEMGNAQSVHSYGQRAKAALESARRDVARLIGALPTEIVFVSGGTEADNFAIRGSAEAKASSGRHIITTQIEHPAVLATCDALEREGFRVTYLPVSRRGIIDIGDLRAALSEETSLISIMHANNEIGTIQPIREVSELVAEARRNGHSPVLLHSDAVQSVGKIPVDVNELGVDLLSVSAHKIHGPKGIGCLYVRKGTRLSKLLYGGHHERDRRPGTENIPAIAGFGKAAQMASSLLEDRARTTRELRDYLEGHITERIPGFRINGDRSSRLPNISNISFEGVDGESLLIALDLKGIAVSTGSACASGSLEPSHVLKALGLERSVIRGSLRFSLSAMNTKDEIEFAISALVETVIRLREISADE